LEGKRVATVKGASAHYFLDSYLLFNDVDTTKVRVVSLAPEQMSAALERREVDAVAIWEPHAYLALKTLGTDGAVLPSPRIYTETFNLIADRHTIIERGRVAWQGSSAELNADRGLWHRYLGV